jgi:NADH:ubiquinone oxidoreductase subunit E
MGADQIVAFLAARLNIKPGQTTPDRMFTLSEVECLACCGTAPVVMCNDRYYEMVTIATLESLLADWSRQANELQAEH